MADLRPAGDNLTRPAIRTIVAIFRYLRAFTEWLTDRGIRRLS
ncbi:hypothetical protein [Micromonospora sp. CPCC 206061]